MSTESRALGVIDYNTLEAIAGRIIPTTDTPGAIEAGAVDYINQALAGPYGRHLGTYERGIAELNHHCTAKLGKPFAELAGQQQDEILKTLEAGRLESVADSQRFFNLVRTHVMEGFFCEPHYGGNRGMIGWKLVGFPGQQYGYDDPYINRAIDLEPVASPEVPQRRK